MVKNEMQLLRMDEQQQLSWLKACRLTLMLVGAVWIAMIFWELGAGSTPWFMIVMVPAFALFRLLAYRQIQVRNAQQNRVSDHGRKE
ncbi:MAG: hypothetical protein KDI38_05990 [Calditrichaeota bacterium]|nr:hypothetical protein [Calditrichota bacterium]MCB0303307.1 hypothetical protein [Calditrichota bacterium]MCB0314558.1 hypothetical protein [Calditrichota bacterium]